MQTAWNWLLSRFYRRVADAHRHFGNLYGSKQEHMSAVDKYSRATILDPNYAEAFYSRGVILWREMGNHENAIEDLTRALELDPSRAEAYFNRGLAYRLQNDPSLAMRDFHKYLEEGNDPYWRQAAQRQLADLREEIHGTAPPEDGAGASGEGAD